MSKRVLLLVVACGCAGDPDNTADTSDASSGASSGPAPASSSDGGEASVSASDGEASSAGDDAATSTITGADTSTGDVPPLDGWCTRGDTALAIAVAELQPRTWVELPANDSLTNLDMGYSLLYWSDSAVWDPQARRIGWVGGPGTCCGNPPAYKRIDYDVESDTWSIEPTPFEGSGHAYDGNALDPTTGLHHFAKYHDPIVHRFDGAEWGTLPELPFATQAAVGLTWFPELADGAGGLVFVDGRGVTAWFDGASWTEIAGAQDEPWGAYHVFAEHNPVHGQVWMGGGNEDDRIHYVLDADLELVRGTNAPVSLNVGRTLHTVDPIGGNYLVKNEDEDAGIAWWEYDALADVWTEIVDMQGTPDFSSTSEFQVPIPECGVILVFAHFYENRHAYLYRHS